MTSRLSILLSILLAMTVALVVLSPAVASGGASFTCVEKRPAPTPENVPFDVTGSEGAVVGKPISIFMGFGDPMIDRDQLTITVVRREDGATTTFHPGNQQETKFTPKEPGTYLISATFFWWDCSGGPGTQATEQGPYTTNPVQRSVVRHLPLLVAYVAHSGRTGMLTQDVYSCPATMTRAITAIVRFTVDGGEPTLGSPTIRITARTGCRRPGRKHPQVVYRHGPWGSVFVQAAPGTFTEIHAAPGHTIRVWLELLSGGKVIAATRARSEERSARRVEWVRDSGACPSTPGGCADLKSGLSVTG